MKKLVLVVGLLALVACGDDVETTISSLNGTWAFSGTSDCEGPDLNLPPSTSTSPAIVLTATNGQATQVYTSESCIATVTFDYLDSGDFLTIMPSSMNVACEPAACTLDWVVNGNHYNLPCDLEQLGLITPRTITVDGSTATIQYESAGLTCEDTYIKQ